MTELLRLKRELFHVEIRRKALENVFQSKRKPHVHYPIEQFISIINKMINNEDLTDVEYRIIDSALDEIQSTIIEDSQKFSLWAEHLQIIKTLIDSMCLSQPYQGIAEKASNCFQLIVRQRNKKVFVNEHIDRAYDIYKSWCDSPRLRESAIQGLNCLVSTQEIGQFGDVDLADQLLNIYADNTRMAQHGKVLNILGTITRNIQDDQKVIKILRIASKLIESSNLKQRIKGLKIVENATQNIQNIQFVLAMNSAQLILDLVYYKDKVISHMATTILCNLTYTVDRDECNKLIELGCLDILFRLFRNQTSSSARKNAGFILSNIFAADYEIIQKILDHSKLIDLIFEILHSDIVEVRREVYHAWKNFVHSCTPQQLLETLNGGLLDYCIGGLFDVDPSIICNCLEFISISIKKYASTQIESDIMEYLARKGVPLQLDSLQRYENEKVYESATQFIKDHYDSDFY